MLVGVDNKKAGARPAFRNAMASEAKLRTSLST
jgi:hypothetical protein